eukprot:scaffold26499_cov69-Phaeocystis_antarctica.AAC.8
MAVVDLSLNAYEVRREDVRRAWDRPKPPKGAHTAPRGAWPKFATKSPKRPCAPRHNEQPLGRFGTLLGALGLSITRYTQ